MRKIELEQGSADWLAWRKKLITATEAGSIMGVNPYCTAYKSWQRKIGLIPEQQETEPMRRGKRDEPIARELFIKQYGIEMIPCCIESEKHSFLGASLDGLSACGKYLLEVKSQSPHFITENGIPDYHYAQVQHQMLSSDGSIEKGFYVSYWDNSIIVIKVLPDIEWANQYIEKAKAYWKCVILYDPPEMTKSDYKNMESEPSWQYYAAQYLQVCKEIKELEERKDRCRYALVELCEDNSCCGFGIKVLKKTTRGRIDYESIPQLKEVDLEKHRKPASMSWTIFLDQK